MIKKKKKKKTRKEPFIPMNEQMNKALSWMYFDRYISLIRQCIFVASNLPFPIFNSQVTEESTF